MGRYRFDPASGTLFSGTREVKLTPKAAHVLALLARAEGRLVSHDEIQKAVWPQGFMHEGNLSQHVYMLRRAFAGDSRVHIENVSRRGYRLCVVHPPVRRPIQLAGAVIAAAVLAFIGLGRPNRALSESANETYRMAMYHLARPAEHRLAGLYFERTVRLAPDAPEGYAGIAILDAMHARSSDRLRLCSGGTAAARRSLALEETALGRAALALLQYRCYRSAAGARQQIAVALQDSSSDPLVFNFAARISIWTGDFASAIAYSKRAVALEPDSPETLSTLGLSQYYAGDFAEGAVSLRRALEIMPDAQPLRTYLAQSMRGAERELGRSKV